MSPGPMSSPLVERLKGHALVLYDGECGFCDLWVQFLLDRDKDEYFLFAPLQSGSHGRAAGESMDSVLLFENGVVHEKSAAVLRLLVGLGFPWTMSVVFRLVPRALRDGVYDFIARRGTGS
ncbi:MAG: DUF393 domain-containing protein [Calothrix sp. SM1_5_4]|nr:DUF393 domain-containing protein [Calothrix sp. SM1_5_4]